MLDFWALFSDLAEIKCIIYHYFQGTQRVPWVNARLLSAIDHKNHSKNICPPWKQDPAKSHTYQFTQSDIDAAPESHLINLIPD